MSNYLREDFSKPKIVYGQFRRGSFAYDDKNHFLSSNEYLIISRTIELKFLLAVLNSKIYYYFSCLSMNNLGGATTIAQKDIFTTFPLITNIPKLLQDELVILATQIMTSNIGSTAVFEDKADLLVMRLYQISDEEQTIILKKTQMLFHN